MKILFRTSGGRISKKQLGLGHIYRCINLSRELLSHDIVFLIEDYGSVSSLLKENNLKYIKLKPGLSESSDIQTSLKIIKEKKIDLVIADKYGLTNKYSQAIKKITKLVVISDLKNIQYDADLLVNGFIGYKNKIMKNKYGTKSFSDDTFVSKLMLSKVSSSLDNLTSSLASDCSVYTELSIEIELVLGNG